MSKDIFHIIQNEEKEYEKAVDRNPTFAPTQGNLLELIDMYWVSQFRDGSSDSLGFKKVFFNIVNFPVETTSKMLDLDTKDIMIIAEDWSSYWPAWLMSKELSIWMKDKYFARELNKYTLQWPKYGHLFVKKVGNDVVFVPPQNMILRPNVDDISTIPQIEKHLYLPDELRIIGKELGWKNLEEAVKETDAEVEDKIRVYEIYLPKGYIKAKDNYYITTENNILFQDKRKSSPWKNLPWEKIYGRTFGRGQVENNFEEQIYLNRIANYKAEGFHWTSLHLYQTRDTNIASNLMTKVMNGDVMIVNSNIEPIANEERNLSAYTNDEDKWMENSSRKTFTREPITGAPTKSGVPLGSTIIQTRMATSYFDQKKEDLASFLKEILWDWILPEFMKEKRAEHNILIKSLIENDDDGSEKFFNLLLGEKMRKRKAKLLANGKLLDTEQLRIMKSLLSSQLKTQDFTIPKGLYENLKYKIDIIITGERLDTGARASTLQTVFQVLGSNPTVLQDKRIRRIFEKMLDMSGINPKDLGLSAEVDDLQDLAGEQKAVVGGSIAAPTAPVPTTAAERVRV